MKKRRGLLRRVLILLIAVCFTTQSRGQGAVEKAVDFFTLPLNERRCEKDSSLYHAKIIIAPVISYSPETSLGFGVGSKILFKMKGSGDETRTSNIPISARYTLENQFIVYSGFEIFNPGEKWMLEGNMKFSQFPRLYYGVGRNTPRENEEHLDYSQLLIEPILLRQTFVENLFMGAGLRYNKVFHVGYENDGVLQSEDYFGSRGSTSAGVELALVYDSRSNLINAKKGTYIELTQGYYGQALGGTHQFSLTRLDLRKYTQPFKNRDDVIAYQFIAHFSDDETPLFELAQLGSGEIMRGYYEGRYIDRNMLAAQVEYRTNIYNRLGAVVFVGVGDVAEKVEDFNLGNVRLSGGVGLRFLLEKREDLNIRMDLGIGNENANYYLDIAEAF